jgi:site-specific DNA-adenine methylase
MTTSALAGWFGSNRTLAATVGARMGRVEWAGVPFCGGCCELPHIRCRSGLAADLHRHLINLARVVRAPVFKEDLVCRLDATLFHPDELVAAQRRCLAREASFESAGGLFAGDRRPAAEDPDVGWAFDYFVCCWMGRGGQAGTAAEFRQGLSVRWNANGGDSCTRFRSAAASLDWWCDALRAWNFVTLDVFAFLERATDTPGHGIYCDPPWIGPGDAYRHRFTEADQRRLARVLGAYTHARLVVRHGDHPLIRELYPPPRWTWIEQTSRSQANTDVAEVLILNPACANLAPSKVSREKRGLGPRK